MTDLACPRCHVTGLVTGVRGWGCPRWREGCAFIVWFEIDGLRLSEQQLHDLVVSGQTAATINGGPARIVLDPNARGGAARLERV